MCDKHLDFSYNIKINHAFTKTETTYKTANKSEFVTVTEDALIPPAFSSSTSLNAHAPGAA